jgi:hypothetical protein
MGELPCPFIHKPTPERRNEGWQEKCEITGWERRHAVDIIQVVVGHPRVLVMMNVARDIEASSLLDVFVEL